jgi:hypothetical protein
LQLSSIKVEFSDVHTFFAPNLQDPNTQEENARGIEDQGKIYR